MSTRFTDRKHRKLVQMNKEGYVMGEAHGEGDQAAHSLECSKGQDEGRCVHITGPGVHAQEAPSTWSLAGGEKPISLQGMFPVLCL